MAPIALRLGYAWSQLTGATSAIVDADGTWMSQPIVSESATVGEGETIFTASWVNESIAVAAPIAGPRLPLLDLEVFLGRKGREYGQVIVDVTGFDVRGEHLAVAAMTDAVAVVAYAGVTTSAEIEQRVAEMAADRSVGVLLLGT